MGKKGKQKRKPQGDQSASTSTGPVKQRRISEMNSLEQYKFKGKEISEKYCMFEDKTPLMLPPAPKQTYIDLYNDDSEFKDDKCRQVNYETEVTVYRALERLEENILVLHGLEYTHHQYRICDKSHDRRNCVQCKGKAKDKSECDFLVVGRNYFVIIEVKNSKHLTESFDYSLKQRERTKSLIEGLMNQLGEEVYTEQCPIFHFTAFPNTPSTLIQNMDEEHKKRIICNEDFSDFSRWWQKNVTNSVPATVTDTFLTKHEEVKEVLIALWCTDGNQCDELKCNLGKCIMDIDQELRKGKITFVSKNRPSNPNVIKVTNIDAANINTETNIFRDIIGVDFLTAEQNEAFNSDQNLLVINGPAGSGKSIILLAKIIKLIKSNEENRAVLFIFSDDNNSCKRYQDALQQANISNVVVVRESLDNADITVQKISDSKQNNQVVIVRVSLRWYGAPLYDVLVPLIGTNTHVFVDDCQGVLYNTHRSTALLLPRCKELSVNNRVWFTCDLTQMFYYYTVRVVGDEEARSFIQDIPSDNIVTLSLNLRNTFDIAGILSKIRVQLILEIPEVETANIDVVLPVLQPGHFIHGPRIVVHVIDKKVYYNDLRLFDSILNIELDKLCNTGVSGGFNIGIVECGYNTTVRELIKKTIEERSTVSDNKIELCDIDSCYSVEYPAVIVLHDVYSDNISTLYLEVSRARVYCAVILYTTEYNIISEHQSLSNLLNKLDDSVRTIRY